jgi:hypothetical protein
VDAAPLQKRGWVLQERMLSPRILHFTDQQFFWGVLDKVRVRIDPD